MKGSPPDEWHRMLLELFEQASELPVGERERFLEDACKGNRVLIQEVIAILKEAETNDSPFKELVEEMVWPALETLSRDASMLNLVLNDLEQGEHAGKDPLIGRIVSHYEIKSVIGRGGMGMVYHARDTVLDRSVALKFLPPALSTDQIAKERFIQEAKAASALDHSNIATIHEIGESEDGHLFIAMGYYPGETLKEKIAKGPVSFEELLGYAIQLASALNKVEQHGVIHRDIKPGNILITEEGTIKLLDFGLAKLSYASGYTQVGQMIGTVAYMSPEQAKGIGIDHRTDIWSLGVVLYEMLTGQLPFSGDDASSMLHSILFTDPLKPVSPAGALPEALANVIGLCLAKNPDERYQSARELLDDLQLIRQGMIPDKQSGRKTWHFNSNQRLIVGLAAMATLIISSAVFFLAAMRSSQRLTFTRINDISIVDDAGFFLTCQWGDYDDDGFLDVVIIEDTSEDTSVGENGDKDDAILLYHNNRDGSFSLVPNAMGDLGNIKPFAAYWADQDNDGDLDLFVTTKLGFPNLFFQNDGQDGFTRVTEGEWVTTPRRSEGAAWGDYDNDGWVDLFVVDADTEIPKPNLLYRNLGNGKMEAVDVSFTRTTGVSHQGIWTDRDNDGDLDLFVAGLDPVHFRNEGDGTFAPVPARPYGIPEYTDDVDISFSSADYDNDGDFDIAYIVWGEGPGVILYRNEGGKRLTDVSYVLPFEGSANGMSANWGDFDNDGNLDLFIANNLGKNLLYHNRGDGTFSLVRDLPIVEEGMRTGGTDWADFDNDGDLDILVLNGAGSKFGQPIGLFRNDGGSNHWIIVKPVGKVSNFSGIGAKIWVRAQIHGSDVTQLREITSDGSNTFGLRAHFGLGRTKVVETLRIEWPSGIVQELHDVPADQILVIEEQGTLVNAGESRL